MASTSNVLYEAKRFIELNPGFNTSQGAVFQAQTKGCP
ncbi:3-coathanger stack domain-containing protein [Runella sp. CRIBMP]